jgi:RNA polymerase sigma factor (sigma-70 family)
MMITWGVKRGGMKRGFSLEELHNFFILALQGNEESKGRVFDFLRSRLLSLARYRVPELAEDIVQDTLLVVHNHFPEFQAMEGLIAFTHKVLRNKIGNIYQGRYRQTRVELEDAELRYDIRDELEGGELDRIVREAISKLGTTNPGCHAILSCLYQGFDPDDISNTLGITKSKLKVRTFRCRSALRDLLSREYRLDF